MGTDDLLTMIERFEAARDELKGTIREAHETVQTMRTVERELKAATEDVRREIKAGIADTINQAVTDEFEKVGPVLKYHMERSVERIHREFKKLENAYLRSKEGTSLVTMVEDIFGTGEPKKKAAPTRRTGGEGGGDNARKKR